LIRKTPREAGLTLNNRDRAVFVSIAPSGDRVTLGISQPCDVAAGIRGARASHPPPDG